jgi:hypothetical protein
MSIIFRFGARNGDRNARTLQWTRPSNVWRHFLFIPRRSQRGQFAGALRARRRQFESHHDSPLSSLRTGNLHQFKHNLKLIRIIQGVSGASICVRRRAGGLRAAGGLLHPRGQLGHGHQLDADVVAPTFGFVLHFF